jgi:hypothetical protein
MHRDQRLIYNRIKGFHTKFTGINEFGNYFPTVKPMDRVHGTVDQWRSRVHGAPSRSADTRQGGALPAHDMPGAMGLGSSLTKAGEEGGDEAELVRGSPELERGRRGRATAEEGGDGKLRGT